MHFPEALRNPLPFSALNMPFLDAMSTSTPPRRTGEAHEYGAESLLSALYSDESLSLAMRPSERRELLPEEAGYSPYEFPFAFDSATLDAWDLNSPLLEDACTYSL